jgi:hypothetical protein
MPDWPAMPDNQIFHTSEDHARWIRRRQPLGELPSRFFRTMETTAEGDRRPGASTPDLKGYIAR